MARLTEFARAAHFARMQRALEEGLRAIEAATTPAEADSARERARARMEELNRMWQNTFQESNAN